MSDYSVVSSVEEWRRNLDSKVVVALSDITVPAFYLVAGVVIWRLCALPGKAAWSGAAVLMVYGLDMAGKAPHRLSDYGASRFLELSGWDREVEIAGYVLLGGVLAAVAYRADRGWTPYTGRSPHTDHVHFSFSWAGARKETTWWTRTTQGDESSWAPVQVPSAADPAGRHAGRHGDTGR